MHLPEVENHSLKPFIIHLFARRGQQYAHTILLSKTIPVIF